MPRVLVTGATGLIGRNLVEHLVARGDEVLAVTRDGRPFGPGVTTAAADLLASGLSPELLDGVDVVQHLAWYGAADRMRSPENVRWVDATLGVVAACIAAGVPRVVTAGTCVEYDLRSGAPVTESSPCRPTTPYGAAKLEVARGARRLAAGTGTTTAHARIFYTFGRHELPPRLVAYVARQLLAGEVAQVSAGEQRRDYLAADQVAAALAALADATATGPVNIGSGRAVPVCDLVALLAERIGRTDLVRYGSRPRQADDPDLIEADIGRLVHEVGFHPDTDLAAQLDATIAWHRSQLDHVTDPC